MNKIRAYSLQAAGCDTVESNRRLNFQQDCRDSGVAVDILKAPGMKCAALITDNPGTIQALKAGGVPIVRRVPLTVPPTPTHESCLRTKEARMGRLPAEEEESPSRRQKGPSGSGNAS